MKNNGNHINKIRTEKKEKKIGVKICLLVLFSLIIPTIAGIVIGIGEIKDSDAIYGVQGVTMFIGCIILMIIIKCSAFSLKEIGFTRIKMERWMIGLVMIELVVLVFGFHTHMNIRAIVLLIGFMTFVGIFEEIIYRGLILKYLHMKHQKSAVFISALLFGIAHIINILSGANVVMTIVQIVFAILFGIVCAKIVLLTKNITLVIVWHAIHNIIDQITMHPSMNVQLIIVSTQCILLATLAYMLWKKPLIKKRL